MNIFHKIKLINKIVKVVKLAKEHSFIGDVKEGIRLIKEGLDSISKAIPEAKGLLNDINNNIGE